MQHKLYPSTTLSSFRWSGGSVKMAGNVSFCPGICKRVFNLRYRLYTGRRGGQLRIKPFLACLNLTGSVLYVRVLAERDAIRWHVSRVSLLYMPMKPHHLNSTCWRTRYMPKFNLLAARLPQTQMSSSLTADVKLQVQFLGKFRLHRARAHCRRIL